MRKFSLIPIALITVVGVVWASSIITPDRPGFPAVPTGTGTLGYTLTQFFRGDGTAIKGQRLGGDPASAYLKNASCPGGDQVWKGVDASGNPICKGPPLAFAEIVEGTMTVNGVAGKGPGTKLIEGDKIETNSTQTGTIRFANNPGPATGAVGAGDSIARLGTGTTVLVDRGDTAGTLALITLQDGLLWGRILTSTGIDFGGGGVIAGVRGTSIGYKNPSGNNYTITIPHSQRSANAGILTGRVIIPGGNIDNPLTTLRSTVFGVLTQSNYTAIQGEPLTTLPVFYPIGTRTALYNADHWARSNTLLDITYMRSLPPRPMITAELAATIPPDSSKTERRGLCASTSTIYYTESTGCIRGYANTITGRDLWGGTADHRLQSSSSVTIRRPNSMAIPGTMQDITTTRMWDDGRLKTLANDGRTSDNYTYWSLNNILTRLGKPRGVSNCQRSPHYTGGREFCILVNQWLDSGWTHLYILNPASGSRTSSQGGIWSFRVDDWRDYRYEQKLLSRRAENPVNQTVYTEQTYNSRSYGTIPRTDVSYVRHTTTDITLPYTIDTPYKFIEIGGDLTRFRGRTLTIELSGVPANGSVIVDFGTTTTTAPRARTFSTTIPTSATRIVIGNVRTNNPSTTYRSPINTAVNSIVIQ